ncbi:MAG: hypothetical protein AAGE52_26030 [Myxococcota bacterium]
MGAPQLGILERWALRYLEKRFRKSPTAAGDDDVHVLNESERQRLRRIEQGVVLRAALIGAVTAAFAAGVEVLCTPWLLGPDPEAATWEMQAKFWAVVGPLIGVAAVIEIALLYWDSLRSVYSLSDAAGLRLFGQGPQTRTTALALARAALELPNPQTAEGIDAHREVSKVWLVTVGLLYKLKVGLTSFLLKALVRRAAGRAAVRAWLVWVAVPVTALWDAITAWRIVREARLRAMGPSAAHELASALFEDRPPLSEGARVAALQAVGGSIVSTHDMHPNLLALLRAVEGHLGDSAGYVLDDTKRFLEQLDSLDPKERLRALEVLAVSAIIDGRVTRTERELVADAQTRCGRQGLGGLRYLRRRFLAGQPLTLHDVQRAIGVPITSTR